MRTTVTIDDDLMEKAAELTGRGDSGSLVRLGLEALIARESARRLAALGGSDPGASAPPRRRPAA
ncbi:MAG: type II toxin-antitoxin system VapB family antitoxin [Humibacter sp.]